MPEQFDVAVLGGGPGGYVAAIRAAQLGARTAVIEKDRLGGTCLVRGCIPTKALLQSAELLTDVRRGVEFGVLARDVRFDLPAAQKRRVAVVDRLVKGVEGLMKANGITVFSGHGRLAGRGRIAVDGQEVVAGDLVIATGSVPARLPIKGVERTIDSDAILELREIPARLAVIGGGVVGMEWGALFAALGTEVTVLEMMPQILPMVEADMVALYRRHFEKLGGRVQTEARVEAVVSSGRGLRVVFSSGGEGGAVDADQVLLAAGRTPVTADLGLEEAGVELDGMRIRVDGQMRTSAEHVWAVGDVIGGIMLAHVASYEGVCAVENIRGAHREADYHAAPNCIYTDPEIANVGLGEQVARARGHQVKVGLFPFAALGRAQTLGQTEGAVKVVADERDGTILGVQMVGPRVTDAIAEATLAIQHKLTLEDLDLTMHAHPTLAEALMEAALAADGRAIHVPGRRPATEAAGSARPGDDANGAGGDTVTAINKQEEPAVARSVSERRAAARTEARVAEPDDQAPPATLPDDPARLALKKANRAELFKLYRMMVLIRRFEERAQVEYTRAKIGGYCHLNLGEEATVVGGIAPLRPADYIFTSYREHGHALARGVKPSAVMAELFGKEGGTSHGRGGSMHIFDLERKFMGGYGIVGGHLPLAVGAGFSIRYRQAKDVVFCMFGDGATNIGAFHESLNFARVFELPVVWFCINNKYGMGTAVERASAVADIYKRACAYDMEAIQVDGMDVLEVMRRTHETIEKTRKDSQPRFIEAVAYRFKGHSVVDPDRYRSDEEKERWRHEDPIGRFEAQLRKAGLADDSDFERIAAEVADEVEKSVRDADQSADPPVEELFRYLYAESSGERENA